MKKVRTLTALVALLAVMAFIPTASFAQGFPPGIYKFWIQAVDTQNVKIASGVTCQVYTAGADTVPSTIYTDSALTTPVNGGTITGDSSGICTWYSASSTAVDLYVWHKNGRGFMQNLDVFTHSVVLDTGVARKIVRIPFKTGTGYNLTSYTIPKGAVVEDVVVQIGGVSTSTSGVSTSGNPTEHLTIGTFDGSVAGEDTGGFCGNGTTKVGDTTSQGMQLGYRGTVWMRCHAVLTASSAPNSALDVYISGFHSGTYLSRGSIGQNTTVSAMHAGSYIRFPFIGDGTRKTVMYSTSQNVANSQVHGHFYLLMSFPGIQS